MYLILLSTILLVIIDIQSTVSISDANSLSLALQESIPTNNDSIFLLPVNSDSVLKEFLPYNEEEQTGLYNYIAIVINNSNFESSNESENDVSIQVICFQSDDIDLNNNKNIFDSEDIQITSNFFSKPSFLQVKVVNNITTEQERIYNIIIGNEAKNITISMTKKNEKWDFYKSPENNTIKLYISNEETQNITKQHELLFVVLSTRCFLMDKSFQLDSMLTIIQKYLCLPVDKAYSKNDILSKLKNKKDFFERDNIEIENKEKSLNAEKIIKLSELEEVKTKVEAENNKKDELEEMRTKLLDENEGKKMKAIEGYRLEINNKKNSLKVQQTEDNKIQIETESIKYECDILKKEINEKTVEVGQLEEIISHGENIEYDGEKIHIGKALEKVDLVIKNLEAEILKLG